MHWCWKKRCPDLHSLQPETQKVLNTQSYLSTDWMDQYMYISQTTSTRRAPGNANQNCV